MMELGVYFSSDYSKAFHAMSSTHLTDPSNGRYERPESKSISKTA